MTGEVGASPDYVDVCRLYLMSNEWPTDETFLAMFESARIYLGSRLSRTRLILTSLEESYHHRELVQMSDAITIEHIMPQSLNAEWRRDLGEHVQEVHEKYLHTIGNLTLTGYNTELGNAVFAEKREKLANSHFELNRDICHAAQWGRQRFKHVLNRLLTARSESGSGESTRRVIAAVRRAACRLHSRPDTAVHLLPQRPTFMSRRHATTRC